MKTIGFIDIHPQNPLLWSNPVTSEPDQRQDEESVIYLFKGSGGNYIYEKVIPYASQKDLSGIDEFYVSIPTTALDFRILNFPFSDNEKIKKVIPFELDNLIIGGSEGVVFDSIVLGSDETSTDALVVYIGKKVLNNVLQELSDKNIDPCIVTSLDLRCITSMVQDIYQIGSPGNLIAQLTDPQDQKWDENQRIDAAKQEMSNSVINLRTGQFSYKKDMEKVGKALKWTVILAFILAFAVHANILFQAAVMKRETDNLNKEIRASYGKLFPSEKKAIDSLYQLKSHLKEITDKDNALSGVNMLQFIMELSNRREVNVVYTEISLEKGLIKMKGEAPSMADLNKIKVKLSEFLPEPSISDVSPAANGKFLFTVVAKDVPK